MSDPTENSAPGPTTLSAAPTGKSTNIPRDARLSVVVPCFNEMAVLPQLHARLVASLDALGLRWEAIFVDDGSTDGTYEKLREMHTADPRLKALALSRNFGHQVAISAGLAAAEGDYVAVIDADLQDPPELISSAVNLLQQGYDVVYAVRRKRKGNLVKRAAYHVFYRLLGKLAEVKIPLDAGDFSVMTRRVVDVLNTMRERHRFVRGLRAWTGFRQIGLEYDRESRAAGATKYPFRKLFRLAADGIFSFSTGPLRFSVYLGMATLAFCFAAGLFILVWRLAGFRFMGHVAADLPGWSAVILALILFSGVHLTILGVMGIYLGMIYGEVKQRPRWVTRESLGLQAAPSNAPDNNRQS
jgi:polyisoprenyl-phosphate glycosyltransferase